MSLVSNSGLIDWRSIFDLVLLSREIDLFEEENLYPEQVPYQFSAKGHEITQVLLARLLQNPKDGVCTYYRGRPLLLGLDVSPQQVFAASLAKASSYSAGRDIGVVANLPSSGAATVLPTAGDVGAQYTPATGWAESLKYYTEVLGIESYSNAIAVAHGGDGSVASNGFWAALNIATTRSLPLLFCIEDNGFAISVPSVRQVPGGNIAKNLAAYGNLEIIDVDGTDPLIAQEALSAAVNFVRTSRSPALIRLDVCRLSGHSGQDTQAYKSAETISKERSRDPLLRLVELLGLSEAEFLSLREVTKNKVKQSYELARDEEVTSSSSLWTNVFSDSPKIENSKLNLEGSRINLVDAVRKTLFSEMRKDPKMILLGEDIGTKGGVHTATMGLREEFGQRRVVDTSLSEEGIVGSSVGLAIAGLRPVPEIQFRKYADAATEQLVNCGTLRWRTNGRFSAPIVVRMPVGVARKVGDPWHSVSGESIWAHQIGWHIAMPSTVEDATGLLRTALRGSNPVMFFEHRALLDADSARGVYPGDDYQLPFGEARCLQEGVDLTVVTWGLMVERCQVAINNLGADVELIDLRTIQPWDSNKVIESVKKTGRLLIVHEDTISVGFGAEIAAVVAEKALYQLDAPIKRLAVEDIPIPYHPKLTKEVVPSVDRISLVISEMLAY